jgi:hypothetical protein
MTDGDIYIHRSIGSVRTDNSTVTTIPLSPTPPTIADDQHYYIHALVWRMEEAYKDAGTGPYVRTMEIFLIAQDNGTYIHYNYSTVNVLKTGYSGGDNSDTIAADFSGSTFRIRAVPSGGGGYRRWFAVVTLYQGDHVLV